MKRVYLDIEANGLLPDATQIWVIGCKDLDTGEETLFTDDGRYGYKSIQEDFKEFFLTVDKWAGHNLISYDARVIKKLLGLEIPWDKVEWDTLILSRMFNFERESGHSLDNLSLLAGGVRKQEYTLGFEDLNKTMIEYNIFDLRSGVDVLNFLKKEGQGTPLKALRLEHEVQAICGEIEDNGFMLDIDKATNLVADLTKQFDLLGKELTSTHPKIPSLNRVVKYKVKKDGTLHPLTTKPIIDYIDSLDQLVGDYSLIDWTPFSPTSRQQVVWQLLHKGWKPAKFTDKGNPVADGEVLGELIETFPEAKELGTYFMLNKRISQVSSWIKFYNPVTGRVHGQINGIGTKTHRASHSNPNLGQVPGVKLDENDHHLLGMAGTYSCECRSCWTVPEGYSLVGVDAAAIQLVILAHCMGDEAFSYAVAHGKKSDGSDVHTFNRNILRSAITTLTKKDSNYFGRAQSKTFIYGFLLGAGNAKAASICSIPAEFGGKLKQEFLNRLPKLKAYLDYLRNEVKTTGKIKSIDGRFYPCTDPHYALAFILQGYEALIMKMALVKTNAWIKENNIPTKIVAWVHDEFQMETKKGYEEEVVKNVVRIIEEVGKELKLKCYLTGSGDYGSDWSISH